MNRRILATLIVIPVAAFASAKIIGSSSNFLPSSVKSSLISTTDENVKVDGKVLTNEELIDEMKLSIQDREGRQAKYQDMNIKWLYEEGITDDRQKFIQAKLIKKVEAENICSIDLQKSFSRCPSGYEATLVADGTKLTNEGWLLASSGCDMEPVAMFRYDVAANTMEAKVSDRVGYVSINDFCKIYKAASKSL